MAVDTIELADVEITTEETPPEVKRVGAPSKWTFLIEIARTEAEKAAKAKPPVRAADGGSPWVVYPKKGKDGKRESIVGTQNLYNLLREYGGPDPKRPKGSQHFQDKGEFFEFVLSDRVMTGEKKSSSKGVLWVRRGTPKP
jgi:hypothetical protein